MGIGAQPAVDHFGSNYLLRGISHTSLCCNTRAIRAVQVASPRHRRRSKEQANPQSDVRGIPVPRYNREGLSTIPGLQDV